jgi:hypothetical protein
MFSRIDEASLFPVTVVKESHMKRIGYLSLPLAMALQAAAPGAEPAPVWSGAPMPAAESNIEWGHPAPPHAAFHDVSATEVLPGHAHAPLAPYAGCGDLGLNACCERQYSPLDGLWAGYCYERSHHHPVSALCSALRIDRHKWGGFRAMRHGCCGDVGPAPAPAACSVHPEAPMMYESAPVHSGPSSRRRTPVEATPTLEDPMDGPPAELAPPSPSDEAPDAENAGQRGARGWLPLPRFNRLPL